jgi:hypothetical protein
VLQNSCSAEGLFEQFVVLRRAWRDARAATTEMFNRRISGVRENVVVISRRAGAVGVG